MSQAKEYIVKVKSPQVVDDLISELGRWNVKVYNVSKVGFCGFTARMGTLIAKWFKDDARIETIEATTDYELQTVQPISSENVWYLDRIDQPALPLNGYYSYTNSGDNINIYTVDSGVSYHHIELADRVAPVYDPNFPTIIFDPVIDQRIYDSDASYNEAFERGADELGHGTFIAGLAVSVAYGVAKGATVKSAKVFGQTTASSGRIIAGLNAVYQDYINLGKPPSVVNLSFASIIAPVEIVSLTSTAPIPSNFTINGNSISITTGTIAEIIQKINALALPGIIASDRNGKLVISINKIGSVTLVDGTNSPLAALGITPGTYQNMPTLVEQAIINMVNDGMHFAISAGNYGIDASMVSPARIGEICPVIVVGATDKQDKLADFTNVEDNESTLGNVSFNNLGSSSNAMASCYGPVVDIYAPGVRMESTWLNSYNTSTMDYNESIISSGTSFATPLVTGAMAMVLQNGTITPTNLKNTILSVSSTGVITGLPVGSNNRLLTIPAVDTEITWTNYGPFGNLAYYTYYELYISAISFAGPATHYTIENGSLPIGLTLESSTGRIYGTISNNNSPVTYTVTIKAHNGYNESPSDPNGVVDIDFGVIEGTMPALWITPANLGLVREGDPINIVLEAENVSHPSTPIDYSVVGSLPYGWILVGNQVLGTAPIATNGNFDTGFSINAYDGVSNSTRSFTLTIEQNKIYGKENEPYWITDTGIIGTFAEGDTVSIQLQAADDNNDPLPLTYNLSISDGDGSHFNEFGELPPGLALDVNTGVISGQLGIVPDETTSYEFAVYLSDGANVVANLFSILVYKQHYASSIIWDTPVGNLASGFKGDTVDLQLQAHDTAGLTVTYLTASGNFPNGISMNSTGAITGVIEDNVDHVFVFTVYATNGYKFEPATFSIITNKINVAPVWVTDPDLGSFPEGSFINVLLQASDEDGDLLSFISNDLPSGLYIQDGYLRGTLGTVDEDTVFTFHITVSDILSNPTSALTAEQEFSLTVTDGALNPNSPPVWFTPEGPLPSGITNQPYTTSLIAIDPEATPVTYQLVAGNLPPGLLLGQSTGVITGTIGFISIDTGYDMTISASDGVFTVNRSFNIFVSSAQSNQPPVWITSSDLGTVVSGQPATINFVANDPEGTVITYGFVSGNLPVGMLFNSATGQLSGVPTNLTSNDTTYQFTISATDRDNAVTNQQFSLVVANSINIAPTWITPSGQLTDGVNLIEYHPGQNISFQFEAEDEDNGPLPLSYKLSNDSLLPYGITISTSGLMTGFVGDVYSAQDIGFNVEVTDGAAIVTRNFTIRFVPTPAYSGVTCDLYVPLSMDLVNMLKQWNVDSMIPDAALYMPGDPKYGRATQYNILVTNNLHTSDKNEIQDVLADHHKKFSSLMGIPTYAIGRDNYGNAMYEVIYIPVLDPQKGSDYDIPDVENLQYFSHSFDNIRQEVKQIENDELLPAWMRSAQDSNGTVLGYTPAIVLAYVQPGQALGIIQRITQIINQTSYNIQETTFDRHVLLADKVNPTVTVGSQMSIDGTIVTFTGTSILSAKADIEQALSLAGVADIRVYLEDSVEFEYDNLYFQPTYGYALRFNYVNNYITLTNVSGNPCEELGFKPISNVETMFDSHSTTFDYQIILDEKQNIKTDGLSYVGTELLFDRYVSELSNGQAFQVKWAPDYQEVFYDGHTEEFWSANPPIWITPAGELGLITTELPVTIQLRTKHHLVDQIISYEVVFGSLPPNFTLNRTTGVITGVAGQTGQTTFFTVRAYDRWGNYKDRGFTLSVGDNILRIDQFIIMIEGDGISIGVGGQHTPPDSEEAATPQYPLSVIESASTTRSDVATIIADVAVTPTDAVSATIADEPVVEETAGDEFQTLNIVMWAPETEEPETPPVSPIVINEPGDIF